MSNPSFPIDDGFDSSEEELNGDGSVQDWSAVEQKIFAARNYVVPGDQLRPRTVEAAREICEDKQRRWRITRLVAAMVLGFAILIPTLERFRNWRDDHLITDSSDLARRAEQLSRSAGFGPNWGLYEAYSELRTQQAAKLGRMVQ